MCVFSHNNANNNDINWWHWPLGPLGINLYLSGPYFTAQDFFLLRIFKMIFNMGFEGNNGFDFFVILSQNPIQSINAIIIKNFLFIQFVSIQLIIGNKNPWFCCCCSLLTKIFILKICYYIFLFRFSSLSAVKIAIKVIIYFFVNFYCKNNNKFNGNVK